MLESHANSRGTMDVLAGNGNPITILSDGYISHRQCSPEENLFEFSIVERESAHCAVLGAGDKEAILRRELVSCPKFTLPAHVRQQRRQCCSPGTRLW
jgi:hypothetical protein